MAAIASKIPGGVCVFLLTMFNILIQVLLIVYVFYRLAKTRSIRNLISFTLQLSAFTIVLLSLVNGVQTNNLVEVFYLTFGIIIPGSFLVSDFYQIIKNAQGSGSARSFSVAEKLDGIDEKSPESEAVIVANTAEVMSIAANINAVSEILTELEQEKDELFKGIKKKLIQADEYYNQGDFDAASESYRVLTDIFNTSPNLHFRYANVLFNKSMLSQALAHYRKVLELDEQIIRKINNAALRSDSNKEVIQKLSFNEYLVYYNIAVAYLIMGKSDLALENFEKSLKINPGFDNAREGIGRVLMKDGQNSEAAGHFEKIVSKDNNNYTANLILGRLMVKQNKNDKAVQHFERCLKIKPEDPEAYTEFGKLLMVQKKFTEAIAVYRKYTDIKNEDYYGHYNLAICYYKAGEYKKAIAEYQKAIELNEKSFSSFYNLALVYEDIQEFDKAIECYKSAILLKIDFVDAYNNLGVLFSKLQRQFEALATYSNGIKACPGNFKLYYNMGVVLFELRRYEDAADAFNRAIEIEPREMEVYYYLGASLTELKKYEGAIKAYSKALNEKVSDGELYYNIAAVYALMKKQDIAIDNLKKAIKINPEIKNEVYLNRVFDYMQDNSNFYELIS
jgi:tetratricopeptide (TPR) repeat protein